MGTAFMVAVFAIALAGIAFFPMCLYEFFKMGGRPAQPGLWFFILSAGLAFGFFCCISIYCAISGQTEGAFLFLCIGLIPLAALFIGWKTARADRERETKAKGANR